MKRKNEPVSCAADAHPDEEQLHLALECELPIEDVERVEQHLDNCWACRGRFEEMQRGILAFVEYREERYLPVIAVPPSDTSGFHDRLRNVLGETPLADWWTCLWRKPMALLGLGRHVTWAGSVAIAMALVILWVQVFLNPAAVSAAQLLTRAVAAQNPAPNPDKSTRKRIARQRVQVRRGNQSVVRNFEWTLGAPNEQEHWGEQPDLAAWNAPLTADGFAYWRSSLSLKKDKVTRSGNLLTLNTTTDLDRIKQASLVIRADDFHPIEQHLLFADDQQLDLTELSFQIVEEALPAIQLALPTASPSKSSPALASTSVVDLDEAELQLRYALFEKQWDLDEELVIGRSADTVTLSGGASSLERGKAMEATLSKLPNVQLSIGVPSLSNASTDSLAGKNLRSPSIPLLKDALEATFPSREERLAFVYRCLADSEVTLSHAWALRRLIDRYSDHEQTSLKPESAARLLTMLRSHMDELVRANRSLASLLEMLPDSEIRTASVPSAPRARVASLLISVQEQERAITSLIVGSQTDGRNIGAASADLRSAHETINKLLTELTDLAVISR